MNSLLKKMLLKVPRLGSMHDEIEFLKKENKSLLEQNKIIEKEMDKTHIECEELCKRVVREMELLQKDNKKVYDGNTRLEEQKNFLLFRLEELNKLHDDLVMRVWNKDNVLKKYTCRSPFERIEILPDGNVYTCCSAYLKHNFYIGNIYIDTIDEIWNSVNAKKLRFSVSNSNFEFCNHMCKWLHELKTDDEISPIRLRDEYNFDYNNYEECVLNYLPREISLSCDETCNLTCLSCRNEHRILDKEKSDLLYRKLMEIVRPMLTECKHLSALGSGDIFASRALSKFYKTLNAQEFPDLKLLIITNAQLLTPKKWEEFSNLQGMQIDLVISVDAAKKETYEKLRRGSKWDILCNNMNFISTLRKQNILNRLSLNFLIQKENYNQINDFIDLGRKWNVDIIEFQKLTNWGTFSTDSYSENDVLNTDNKYYKEVYNSLKLLIEETKDIKIVQNIL